MSQHYIPLPPFCAVVPVALDLITCPLLSCPLNVAWADCTSNGWHCICGERLWIYLRQLAVMHLFSAAPARASEVDAPPPHDSDQEDDIETSDIARALNVKIHIPMP